jgi:glycosyltransferase involved in cell wall biosynthesis
MAGTENSLKILHVFRSPVGGLFRHVVDLVEGQSARGHRVGLVTDSLTGGARAEATLAGLARHCALGISRIAMSRQIGPGDMTAVLHTSRRIAQTRPDVVHGHGAKGAAYARLASRGHAVAVYTPHGGSLHYRPQSPVGLLYITLEKILRTRTDLFLFESDFAEQSFRQLIGPPHAMTRVVRNGVSDAEFSEVPLKADATDVLYIGELRDIKGVDVLLDALAALRRQGIAVSATIVGDGPARQEIHDQAARLALTDAVRFEAPMPARQAFALGRLVVVPSRKESLPYIVLEIAACGKPLIATHVGGIPEIFGAQSDLLIPPGNSVALADTLKNCINHPETIKAGAALLQERIRTNFALTDMVEGGIAAYRAAIAAAKAKLP